MSEIPNVPLSSDYEIPQVGFGVFLVPPPETKAAVSSALRVGYRHIDTATLYKNEAAVGEAIAESGIARGDIFLTTKCWNGDQGYDRALAAFDASLARLGTEYVDLYLIHWPTPARDLYVETWRALERIRSEGRARTIGVSNFHVGHLQRLLDETDTPPAINQVEMHPWLQQRQLREFHAAHGIVSEAWSPIARGGEHLADPTVVAIAERLGVTAAQVILRWHIDLGNVVIPKSVNPTRMASNLDVFGFSLSDGDRAALDALDSGARVGPNPDTFNGT